MADPQVPDALAGLRLRRGVDFERDNARGGGAEGVATLVVYGDYLCPYCREVTVGALTNPRAALLPVLAAIGGVLAPAAVYLAISTPATAPGWSVPTATDVAFTLGILALLGERIPVALRVFIAALAVVDDILSMLTLAMCNAMYVYHWLGDKRSECCPLGLGFGTICTPAPGTAASIAALISSTVFNPRSSVFSSFTTGCSNP
jgi:hypothetical protein